MCNLHQGCSSKKTIKGTQYFYLQNRVDGDVVSIWQTYPFREGNTRSVTVFTVMLVICILRCGRLITIFSRERRISELSSVMDMLNPEQKDRSISFADAMTAIEGVPVSAVTAANIADWRAGRKSFFTLFNETLAIHGFPTEVNNI